MPELRMLRAYDARPIAFQKNFGSGEIAEQAGSGALALSLGVLPEGAILLQYAVRPRANFTGGSLSAVVGTIGTEDDPDAIASAIALGTGTADGRLRQGTAGINSFGPGFGGEELFLTLTPADDTLDELESGEVDVSLLFVVPDSSAVY